MLLIGLLRSLWAKCHTSEVLVRLFAHWQLDKLIYRRLHNVTLSLPHGTTQIDHVFLSPYGIFVLDTKSMNGWIFGSEKQAQWTRNIYKRTYTFQNPLRQNYKHLKALETSEGVNLEHLHSAITFVSGSTFKTEVPANVTHGIGFIRYIKLFQKAVVGVDQADAMLHIKNWPPSPNLATDRPHAQNLKRPSDSAAKRQLEMRERTADSQGEFRP